LIFVQDLSGGTDKKGCCLSLDYKRNDKKKDDTFAKLKDM
jgi:hypothetical protein